MDSCRFPERPWGPWEEPCTLSPPVQPHKLTLGSQENDLQGLSQGNEDNQYFMTTVVTHRFIKTGTVGNAGCVRVTRALAQRWALSTRTLIMVNRLDFQKLKLGNLNICDIALKLHSKVIYEGDRKTLRQKITCFVLQLHILFKTKK